MESRTLVYREAAAPHRKVGNNVWQAEKSAIQDMEDRNITYKSTKYFHMGDVRTFYGCTYTGKLPVYIEDCGQT